MRLSLIALLLLAGCQAGDSAADAPAVQPVAETAPAPPPTPAGEPLGPDGKPEVVLYVTEWCPYCAQARDYMAEEGVPHRIVDIEKDEAGAREYAARGGTGGIPLVAVGIETMEGWSADYARQMLDAAGY